jgi:predicted dehydrogenase
LGENKPTALCFTGALHGRKSKTLLELGQGSKYCAWTIWCLTAASRNAIVNGIATGGMAMAQQVRYGILSTAQIALNRHIPAAREAPNATVVAVSSRDKKKAEECARRFDIPRAYGSYQEVLDDAQVDAIINPLPNSLHGEWTIKAAEAGKHVLCEKPLATSLEEAQRMIAAARANGVCLMEAFTHRFNPQLQCARRVVQEGQIGEVKVARAELTFTLRDWDNDVRASKDLGGGALLDAGCYCVSALRFVLNAEPVAALGFQHLRRGVDATFSGLLRFPGDHLGYVVTGMEQPFRCLLEVVGSEGRIEVPSMFDEKGVVKISIGNQEHVEQLSAPDRFRVQLERFSACVLQKKAPEFPPEDSLKNTAALVALRRAAESGKMVEVRA